MTTVSVSTVAQFETAMSHANAAGSAGETIVLQAGVYKNLEVSKYTGTGPLLIESANASNQAIIEGMSIDYSSNVTLANVAFSNANITSGINNNFELNLYGSSNITVKNDTFAGPASTALASAAGKGVYVHSDTNVTLSNNTFKYLLDGVQNIGSNGVTENANTFTNIFDDGIDTAGTSNITISGNSFTTFHTDATDAGHPDAIQFWTSGVSSNSNNIVVSNNTITRGSGAPVQGIFITSQNSYGYSNVTIAGNTVTGGLGNGIWLDSTSNFSVTGNTIQPFTDQISRLLLTSDSNGSVTNNKVGSAIYTSAVSGVSLSGNSTLAAIAAFVSNSASIAPTTSVTTVTTSTTSSSAPHTMITSPHG
ncbi:MAG TPA: right-handed parallel beta-helix repeat-containing protein [Caulobacteraceae bacterium]|jgi:parallel beta-helix repeat protein|nr:right-handed parallel beta-helix repeat-containing protein [Caulobacteraceae bacterium]